MNARLLVAAASMVAASALAASALAGCSSSSSQLSAAGGTKAAAGGATTGPSAGAGGSAAGPSVAGGGSGSAKAPAPKPGGSGSTDVCSLLTSAQASAANSVTYSTATPKSIAAGYDTCTYHNTGKHASPVDIQDLTVTVISIPNCWPSLQQADGPGKPVAGVGDAAFGAQIALDVKAGSRCLTVSGLTFAELKGNYAPDVAMAKIIIGNLH
jgi:hypothetical protein